LDRASAGSVDKMVQAVASRLLGKDMSGPAPSEALVWAQAAAFLSGRIQSKAGEMPGRAADMSAAAATAMRTVLAQIEAGSKLMSNRDTVVKDITNPGPQAVLGGTLTQLELKRLDRASAGSVDKMLQAVASRLFGKETSGPPSPTEALVWAQAAGFLTGRIQGLESEMPGRAPDMSSDAAAAMRTVLGQIEAGSKLMSNLQKVVQDITNPGPQAVNGGQLTQLNLKRLDRKHQASVNTMLTEVCGRLFGITKAEPSTQDESQVWGQAAKFFAARIQASAGACPGRQADMSGPAAAAMKTVLARISIRHSMSASAATALCTVEWMVSGW